MMIPFRPLLTHQGTKWEHRFMVLCRGQVLSPPATFDRPTRGCQGQAQVGAKHLLEAALRMRPDRILLQELRDGTAFFYLRNVNSGHPGSITTVHADSAALAFQQLSLLVKESEGGRDLSRADILDLLHMLVDVVVQCKKVDGKFRVTEIHFEPELSGM